MRVYSDYIKMALTPFKRFLQNYGSFRLILHFSNSVNLNKTGSQEC